jgi:hypothetical protein
MTTRENSEAAESRLEDNHQDTERLEKESLVDYRRGVETLMKMKSSKRISNGEPSHAAILFDVFFQSAVSKVRIFAKNLNRDVFGKDFVVASAKKAASKNVDILILLQEDPQESIFLDWAKIDFRVKLLVTTSSQLKLVDFNFTAMDDYAVRVEENNNHCKAWARMYAPALAQSVTKKFDSFFLFGGRRITV